MSGHTSCYDQTTNSRNMLIDEDDLFRLNCQDIKVDDFISLQVVVASEDVPLLFETVTVGGA